MKMIIPLFSFFSIVISSCGSNPQPVDKQMHHPFETFLTDFIPKVDYKSTQLNKAAWILETTGSSDAADLRSDLDTEFRMLFNDGGTYEQLLSWDKDPSLKDPILKRQLNVLIRAFKQNQIPKALVEAISKKESAVSMTYATFRAEIDGKKLTENDLRELLKNETNPAMRKRAWEASKEVGQQMAPQILELVRLRNQVAKALGYLDYFQMQLALQEVDANWLLKTLDDLAKKSDLAYEKLTQEIEMQQADAFAVPVVELGPWSWTDPFGQEDPLNTKALDGLVDGVDIVKASADFYQKMGIDVSQVLARSDMYERPGKSQHAFCMAVNRTGDVRTLNNVKPALRWLETVLHEFGHAVYDLGYQQSLPWLLKEYPHIFTTEAMALLAGRQAYRYDSLGSLVGTSPDKDELRKQAEVSLRRRQLIFSRWVLVMTAFESELYSNPSQDLNTLWWSLVEKYQKIRAPKNRGGKADWAAKYHIAMAPVYYFSYLLGEMFASAMEENLLQQFDSAALSSDGAGKFLQDKLFAPGNRMNWSELVVHVTGKPLSSDAWVREYATP